MEATLNICSNIIYEVLSSLEPTTVCGIAQSPRFQCSTAVTVEPGHRVVPQICAPLNLVYLQLPGHITSTPWWFP